MGKGTILKPMGSTPDQFVSGMGRMLGLVVIVLTLAGCITKKPFTPEHRERIRQAGHDLSQVQFFTAGDILLERVVEDPEVELVRGTVIYRDNVYVDAILIREGTPGVFLGEDSRGRLMVAFESGGAQYLPFEAPDTYGHYYRLSPDREGDYKRYVNYDGKEYRIMESSTLLHRPVTREHVEEEYRAVEGQRVGGGRSFRIWPRGKKKDKGE